MGQIVTKPIGARPPVPAGAVESKLGAGPFILELIQEICEFVPFRFLLNAAVVNKRWGRAVPAVWIKHANAHAYTAIPRTITPKEYLSNLYCFGAEGWKKALGVDIGPVPKIPDDLLEMLRQPDPWEPTKTVETTCVPIYIPNITLRELGLRVAAKFPGTSPTGYHQHSWRAVLEEHGDALVAPGWRCLRKEVVERNLSWTAQQDAVNAEDKRPFVIVSLVERAALNILMQMILGCELDRQYWARTATLTERCPSSTWWPISGPAVRLCLYSGRFAYVVFGVAVGVPSGSS